MKMFRKTNTIFLYVVTFVALGLLSSTQVAFAYNSSHVLTKHHGVSHGSARTFEGSVSSSDSSYEDMVFFNEDDDHENIKILPPFVNKSTFLSVVSPAESFKSDASSLFAKQVHVDYLLEENTREKATTSQ